MPRTDVLGERLAKFYIRWGNTQLGMFGSIVCEDFGPDSDIDILVSLDPNRKYTLYNVVDMEWDLEKCMDAR